MFSSIYVEDSVRSHPRTLEILGRFPDIPRVDCERYTEVFNPKAQSFRLQKANPGLILAEKFGNFVLPAPNSYGIGARENFYFSHMLNCIYDCRYCFLQGMYRSAHYILFVNYEDFMEGIDDVMSQSNEKEIHFFSGYDCDSLAFEPVSKFTSSFLPYFREKPGALLELRTKSTQIRNLLQIPALSNCVVAYSLSPGKLAEALEHKAPSLESRLSAMQKLQESGWQIGLRFDPLIYQNNYKTDYGELFEQVFSRLEPQKIHSVSLGNFRLPKPFFTTLSKMYPDEKLFASPFEESAGQVTCTQDICDEMLFYCRQNLKD